MPFDPSPPRKAPTEPSTELDQRLHGAIAGFLGGQSPWAAYQAWSDWAFHLAMLPGKRLELQRQAAEAVLAVWRQAVCDPENWAFVPAAGDKRFRGDAWKTPPFSFLAQMQLAMEAQWRAATSNVRGVAPHHARRVEFLGRFALNGCAPVNFPWSNPEVLSVAARTAGMNLVKGAALALEDALRLLARRASERP